MLVRRIAPLLRPCLKQSKHAVIRRVSRRALSSAGLETSHPVASSKSPLASLTADLDRHGPRLDIQANQVQIIEGPAEFYSVLKAKIKGAKRRIYLSTLYIGKSEHELIAVIREALVSNPQLQVSILTDALRGTREAPESSCASLLAPLVRDYADRVQVCMYHTPNLTGLRKKLVPKRINEGWGLQHIKLYGIDDEIILSGANLSSDYFTNRQDRYHLFSSKSVTEYFARIHEAVCDISFRLEHSSGQDGFQLIWPESNRAPDPLLAPDGHKKAATALLRPLILPSNRRSEKPTTSTSVYPVLCFPGTINTELPALDILLSRQRAIQLYTFTAGYFNPHPSITTDLLTLSTSPSSARGTILTASPFANGFYGSNGISGMLPAAYTHLSTLFLQAARGKPIQLREWQRGTVNEPNGWTYHAKGIWVTLSDPAESGRSPDLRPNPQISLIGSSNYTTRSYGLDLEVGALVVSSDGDLQARWAREKANLVKDTTVVNVEELKSEERRASWKVKMAMWVVRIVGGAL